MRDRYAAFHHHWAQLLLKKSQIEKRFEVVSLCRETFHPKSVNHSKTMTLYHCSVCYSWPQLVSTENVSLSLLAEAFLSDIKPEPDIIHMQRYESSAVSSTANMLTSSLCCAPHQLHLHLDDSWCDVIYTRSHGYSWSWWSGRQVQIQFIRTGAGVFPAASLCGQLRQENWKTSHREESLANMQLKCKAVCHTHSHTKESQV